MPELLIQQPRYWFHLSAVFFPWPAFLARGSRVSWGRPCSWSSGCSGTGLAPRGCGVPGVFEASPASLCLFSRASLKCSSCFSSMARGYPPRGRANDAGSALDGLEAALHGGRDHPALAHHPGQLAKRRAQCGRGFPSAAGEHAGASRQRAAKRAPQPRGPEGIPELAPAARAAPAARRLVVGHDVVGVDEPPSGHGEIDRQERLLAANLEARLEAAAG